MPSLDLPERLRFRRRADGAVRWWWEPSKTLAKVGWRPVALGFTADDLPNAGIVENAKALNSQVEAWRAGRPMLTLLTPESQALYEAARPLSRPEKKALRRREASQPPIPAAPAPRGTVQWLVEAFWRDDRQRVNADGSPARSRATLKEYERYCDQLVATLGDKPVAAVTARVADVWYTTRAKASLSSANAATRVFRIVWKWAARHGHLPPGGVNPWESMRLVTVPGRIVVFSPAELDALIRHADATDRAWLGDAIWLAVGTGLRLGDLVALPWRAVQGDRLIWTPSKTAGSTAVALNFQLPAPLVARLAEARQRSHERRVAAARMRGAGADLYAVPSAPPPADPILMSSGRNGRLKPSQQYHRSSVGHAFGDLVREVYVAGLTSLDAGWDRSTPDQDRQFRSRLATARRMAEEVGDPVPEYVPNLKRFQDLRDTAVTWLHLAGVPLDEIRSITGHAPDSMALILRHYLASDVGIGDAATRRLTDFLADADRVSVANQRIEERKR